MKLKNDRYMKCFILTVVLALSYVMPVSAQFFNFDFGSPFIQRERPKQETVTAPEFKGGKEAVEKFLVRNFKNPVPADKELDGRIVVALLVNKKGKVTQCKVVQGLEGKLDAEAQRVGSKMKFKPARRGKEKVSSRYDVTFPIRRGRLSFSTLDTLEL